MVKKILVKLLLITLLLTLALDIKGVGIKTVKGSGTYVGGIISEDTVWTLENSPYIVTNTVQIPDNVTLTIEPGVTIIFQPASDDIRTIFKYAGKIVAIGTPEANIHFLYNVGNLFQPLYWESELTLEYCIIEGSVLYLDSHTMVRHCQIKATCYIFDVDGAIEYNTFMDQFYFLGKSKIPVRYNLFCAPIIVEYSEASFKYNSFVYLGQPGESIIRYGYGLNMSENYWGTTDTSIIESIIIDRNDDISYPGYVPYLPILNEPHPDTPAQPEKTPPTTVDDYNGQWLGRPWIILTPVDTGTGVRDVYYRIDNGRLNVVRYQGRPVEVFVKQVGEGVNHTLEYWSVDYAGNEEPHKILTDIKIDLTPPVAVIEPTSLTVFVGEEFTLNASRSTDNLSGIAVYKWYFDDGTWGTGPIVTHQYPIPGFYTISLTVEDMAGNRVMKTAVIMVLPSSSPTTVTVTVTRTATVTQSIISTEIVTVTNVVNKTVVEKYTETRTETITRTETLTSTYREKEVLTDTITQTQYHTTTSTQTIKEIQTSVHPVTVTSLNTITVTEAHSSTYIKSFSESLEVVPTIATVALITFAITYFLSRRRIH